MNSTLCNVGDLQTQCSLSSVVCSPITIGVGPTIRLFVSNVNKDWTPKAKAKDWAIKAKAKD